ncbi:MAG: hypothetical protein JO303_14405 [Caulobacteraceae bacterium]|nr:hypothetical protein [Caulobacteraceae bacterium]
MSNAAISKGVFSLGIYDVSGDGANGTLSVGSGNETFTPYYSSSAPYVDVQFNSGASVNNISSGSPYTDFSVNGVGAYTPTLSIDTVASDYGAELSFSNGTYVELVYGIDPSTNLESGLQFTSSGFIDTTYYASGGIDYVAETGKISGSNLTVDTYNPINGQTSETIYNLGAPPATAAHASVLTANTGNAALFAQQMAGFGASTSSGLTEHVSFAAKPALIQLAHT